MTWIRACGGGNSKQSKIFQMVNNQTFAGWSDINGDVQPFLHQSTTLAIPTNSGQTVRLMSPLINFNDYDYLQINGTARLHSSNTNNYVYGYIRIFDEDKKLVSEIWNQALYHNDGSYDISILLNFKDTYNFKGYIAFDAYGMYSSMYITYNLTDCSLVSFSDKKRNLVNEFIDDTWAEVATGSLSGKNFSKTLDSYTLSTAISNGSYNETSPTIDITKYKYLAIKSSYSVTWGTVQSPDPSGFIQIILDGVVAKTIYNFGGVIDISDFSTLSICMAIYRASGSATYPTVRTNLLELTID